MRAVNLITSAAESYEASLVPGLMAPWADAIVSAARVAPGMSVLDVACGTGIAARYAARRSGLGSRVVGIDIDHAMLDVARAISMKEGLSIDYQDGSADALPFKPQSFDVVVCLQGIQYVPDPLKALCEFHRVLRADSTVVIAAWREIENCKGHWSIVTALERRGIDASPARKPFCLASAAELHSLATAAGFSDITIRSEQRLSCFQSASGFVDAMVIGAPSTRHALEKISSDAWPSFIAEVEELLAPWQTHAGLHFPTQCNVLVARR